MAGVVGTGMSPSIRLSFSSLLLGLALLVAACGGGSTVTAGGGESVTPTSGQPGDPSATATPTPTPTPTPSPTPTPAGDEEALAQLAQARERWAEAGIEDYAYSISESCECPDEISGPRRVTVKAGEVIVDHDEITDARPGRTLRATDDGVVRV